MDISTIQYMCEHRMPRTTAERIVAVSWGPPENTASNKSFFVGLGLIEMIRKMFDDRSPCILDMSVPIESWND